MHNWEVDKQRYLCIAHKHDKKPPSQEAQEGGCIEF
jgi:hypothetical protein